MAARSITRLLALTLAAAFLVPAPASAATATQVTWELFSWGNPLQFRVTMSPTHNYGGVVELLIDGDVHASFGFSSTSSRGSTTPTYSVVNNTSPGPHTVVVRWKPNQDNYSPSSSTPITLDDSLTPPSGILVDGGHPSTNSLNVLIDPSLNGTTGIDQVRISNSATLSDGLLATGTTFAADKHHAWTLAAGPSGLRTVFAQVHYIDGTGWSAVMSDSIYYDTTAPSGTFAINDGDPTVGDPWTNSITEQSIDGSVSDASIASGGSISHMGVSTDLQRWQVLPFTMDPADFSWTDFNIVDGQFGYPFVAGPKTVYVKWRDSAGNWSTPISDTIDLLESESVGYVLVDGEVTNSPNPAYRHTTSVELRIHASIAPPEGLKSVRIGNELEEGPTVTRDWPDNEDELVIPSWSLINQSAGYTSGDGIKNIQVEFISNNNRRLSTGARVFLDRAVPTSDSPAPGFAINTTVSQAPAGDGFGVSAQAVITSAATDIQWKGQDKAGTGVARYDLQRLLSGAWNGVALANPTGTSVRQTVHAGTSTQFRVKATDLAGNVGAWKTGASFVAGVVQDNAAAWQYSGKWNSLARTDALGGTLKQTRVAGASARLTFTGRALALVAPRSSGASADVYIDGKKIKTVQLAAASYSPRVIVFSISWKSKAQHTIRIVKKYVNNRDFAIDAVLILK